jgi:hypothetical protein
MVTTMLYCVWIHTCSYHKNHICTSKFKCAYKIKGKQKALKKYVKELNKAKRGKNVCFVRNFYGNKNNVRIKKEVNKKW